MLKRTRCGAVYSLHPVPDSFGPHLFGRIIGTAHHPTCLVHPLGLGITRLRPTRSSWYRRWRSIGFPDEVRAARPPGYVGTLGFWHEWSQLTADHFARWEYPEMIAEQPHYVWSPVKQCPKRRLVT